MREALAEYGAGPFQVRQWSPECQPRWSPLGCHSPLREAEPQRLNHQPPCSERVHWSTAMSPKMQGSQPSLSRSMVLNPDSFWSMPAYVPLIASPLEGNRKGYQQDTVMEPNPTWVWNPTLHGFGTQLYMGLEPNPTWV